MKRPMVFAEIHRSFKSEAEVNQFLTDNPTYELKLLHGNQGINAVIHDIRMADVSYAPSGELQIKKWL